MVKAIIKTKRNQMLGRTIARMIQTAIYHYLPQAEHNGIKAESGKVFKRFCFDARYRSREGEIDFHFSSLIPEYEHAIADALREGTFHLPDIEIFDTILHMDTADLSYNSVRVFGKVAAKIKDGNGKEVIWLNPENRKFQDIIRNNAKERYETLTGQNYFGELDVKVIKQFRKFLHFYHRNVIEVYPAIYEIEAEEEMLDFLLKTGMGGNLGQGLGLLRPVKR